MPTRKGNNKFIATPDIMWHHFESYRKDVKGKPFKVTDWVGGAGKQVTRHKEKPLTIEGFENWLCDNKILADVGHYFANEDKRYNDYISVCNRIKRAIRQDQIEGGMAMIYNPSITQRLNRLIEVTENSHEVKEIVIKHES